MHNKNVYKDLSHEWILQTFEWYYQFEDLPNKTNEQLKDGLCVWFVIVCLAYDLWVTSDSRNNSINLWPSPWLNQISGKRLHNLQAFR